MERFYSEKLSFLPYLVDCLSFRHIFASKNLFNYEGFSYYCAVEKGEREGENEKGIDERKRSGSNARAIDRENERERGERQRERECLAV